MSRAQRFAARNAFVEASIENAVDILRNAEPVAVRLGDMAVTLADILENDMFIPQVRAGSYVFPKDRLNTESIPAFAIEPGEHIVVVGAGMTPNQVRHASVSDVPLVRHVGSAHMLQMAEAYAEGTSESRGGITVAPDTVHAFVGSRQDTLDFYKKYPTEILGRPLLALIYQRGFTRVAPDVVMHEAVHLWQRITRPLRVAPTKRAKEQAKVTTELEAYHHQAHFIEGLEEFGYRPMNGEISPDRTNVKAIEAARLRINKNKEPFAYSRAWRRSFTNLTRY